MNELPKVLGLSEADHARLAESLQAVAQQGDALVRYWSAERGILWLGLHVGGRLASWLMVPAPTAVAAARAAEFWREVVAEGMQVQANVAESVVADALRKQH